MPGEAELRALLYLRSIRGLGDTRLTALLRRYGSARDALQRVRAERREATASARKGATDRRIDQALTALRAAPEITAIAAFESAYPPGLLDLHDPPPLLFASGDCSLLEHVAVAVVGTRACTEYGADTARAIGTELVHGGFAVISGLAHGIDRHAHEAALDAGGATIAVIGCGIDVVYPRQHRTLYDRIGRDGLIVSEFLPGEPALPHHFPRRNRIIAALSEAVVVVEAPDRSGALITADHALDLGREVLAVPGPIGRRTSAGTNALLRDGATIVTSPRDVIEAVAGPGMTGHVVAARPSAASAIPAGIRPDGPTAAVAAVLTHESRHIDDVARLAGLDPARTLAALLELEIAGHAIAGNGGRYRRPASNRSG